MSATEDQVSRVNQVLARRGFGGIPRGTIAAALDTVIGEPGVPNAVRDAEEALANAQAVLEHYRTNTSALGGFEIEVHEEVALYEVGYVIRRPILDQDGRQRTSFAGARAMRPVPEATRVNLEISLLETLASMHRSVADRLDLVLNGLR